MKPFVYQGVKVKDNYKVVSSEGQTVKENVHFDFVEGMEKSRLELRAVARKRRRRDLTSPMGCVFEFVILMIVGKQQAKK